MKGHVHLPVEDADEDEARRLLASVKAALEAEGLQPFAGSVSWKRDRKWTLRVQFEPKEEL